MYVVASDFVKVPGGGSLRTETFRSMYETLCKMHHSTLFVIADHGIFIR